MLSVRNLINTTDLTADDITQILDTARSMEEINHRTIKKVPALRGRTIVNLFLEASPVRAPRSKSPRSASPLTP